MIRPFAANRNAHSVAPYFTEGSQAAANSPSRSGSNRRQYELEVGAMRFTRDKARTPYARALYAAAVAALLSACTQIDSSPGTAVTEAAANASETSDMPVVVVTASREQPKSIG
jgi:hypothetical protein